MFRKFLLLAVAAFACVNAATESTVQNELLQKIVRYEAEKASALTELAEIQKIVASMNTKVEVSALSTGSTSGSNNENEATVGSGSGDQFSIESPPEITSAPPSTAPAGSAANSESVTTAPPATAKPASSATATHVAPVAVAVVAAAIALL